MFVSEVQDCLWLKLFVDWTSDISTFCNNLNEFYPDFSFYSLMIKGIWLLFIFSKSFYLLLTVELYMKNAIVCDQGQT